MTPIGKALRFTRGLRFRLAVSYVFFFTILLAFLGVVFRQTLSATFQSQMRSVLEEEWGAAIYVPLPQDPIGCSIQKIRTRASS